MTVRGVALFIANVCADVFDALLILLVWRWTAVPAGLPNIDLIHVLLAVTVFDWFKHRGLLLAEIRKPTADLLVERFGRAAGILTLSYLVLRVPA